MKHSKRVAERKQNLFFFEKSGPSYTCLGVFNVSVPNLDETVDEVTKRAMEGLPRSSRYENFTVYWVREHHPFPVFMHL